MNRKQIVKAWEKLIEESYDNFRDKKRQAETRIPLTLVELNLHWIVKVGVAKRMQKTRKNLERK